MRVLLLIVFFFSPFISSAYTFTPTYGDSLTDGVFSGVVSGDFYNADRNFGIWSPSGHATTQGPNDPLTVYGSTFTMQDVLDVATNLDTISNDTELGIWRAGFQKMVDPSTGDPLCYASGYLSYYLCPHGTPVSFELAVASSTGGGATTTFSTTTEQNTNALGIAWVLFFMSMIFTGFVWNKV